MPPSVDAAPDLSGLIELSRVAHLDLKPVILRVQTDLFVQAESRDRAERDSFEALACGLIPRVDDETALIVAEKLGPFPGTPEPVLAALAARGGPVRDAVVAGAPHLSPRLIEAALSDGTDIAGAIAGRPDLERATIEDLARRAEPAIDRALAANTGITLRGRAADDLVSRGRRDPDLAHLLLVRPDLSAAEMAPLFLHADPIRREAICDGVAATAALRPCPPPPRGLGPILTGLSAARDVTGFLGALAEALGLSRDFLGAAADPGSRYDLITLCLRALDLHEEEVVYIFLTLNEGVARSAERVFELVRLFRTTSRAAARDLVAAVTDQPLRDRAGPTEAYQPHHAPEAAKLRTAAAERPAARPALPTRLRKTS
jgi:hypothetical protein